MSLRCLIVDDEPLARDRLRDLLDESDTEVEIVAEAGGGKDAVSLIHDCEPDVVFLDVQMPVLGGFDVVDLLPAMGSPCLRQMLTVVMPTETGGSLASATPIPHSAGRGRASMGASSIGLFGIESSSNPAGRVRSGEDRFSTVVSDGPREISRLRVASLEMTPPQRNCLTLQGAVQQPRDPSRVYRRESSARARRDAVGPGALRPTPALRVFSHPASGDADF